MTYAEHSLSKIRFSSSYNCDSPFCAARWYETLRERCRPPRTRRIWLSDGYLYVGSNKDPRRSITRFIIRSIQNPAVSLADHPRKVSVLASVDKGARSICLLTISCHFESRDDAIDWRVVLQKSEAKRQKQRESEEQLLEIVQLYLRE